jgi:hypothetical protein
MRIRVRTMNYDVTQRYPVGGLLYIEMPNPACPLLRSRGLTTKAQGRCVGRIMVSPTRDNPFLEAFLYHAA